MEAGFTLEAVLWADEDHSKCHQRDHWGGVNTGINLVTGISHGAGHL